MDYPAVPGKELGKEERPVFAEPSIPDRASTQALGFSRPPLEIGNLPSPEEVFKVKHFRLEELVLFLLGPSIIALAVSLGSSAWMYGPLFFTQQGFKGFGWVILISIILQVFYNVELARFTIATGETPVLAFGRAWPGSFIWIPMGLLFLFFTFIFGNWVLTAGASFFTLIFGRLNRPAEVETVRWLGIGLMALTFILVSLGKKIVRTLEAFQGIMVLTVLVSLTMVTLTIVPVRFWTNAALSFFTPALPPRGTSLSLLGSLVSITAFASGLNFMLINYYRDKGFGMGSKSGFIAGWLGGKPVGAVSSGHTFRENGTNSANWKRWFRYLLIDQWGIYFIGCLIGLMVPAILVSFLASQPGAGQPTQANILVYAALNLSHGYSPLLYTWALFMGFIILFSSLIVLLDLLARNFSDAIYGASGRIQQRTGFDPRKIYYPTLVGVIVTISVLIHFSWSPKLAELERNAPYLAAVFFPLLLIFLNRRLPRPARITGWSVLVLAANILFFGLFFVNFILLQVTGRPIFTF